LCIGGGFGQVIPFDQVTGGQGSALVIMDTCPVVIKTYSKWAIVDVVVCITQAPLTQRDISGVFGNASMSFCRANLL
jgi:hypothetical protein